jgi:trimethylamine:corrinoid methyltransferase-like protein
MMAMMASCMAKMNLILMTAGTLDGHMAMSTEQFIVDMELLGMIERFTGGQG